MASGGDPRVGSARDGETAPNASRLSAGANGSSLDTLVATLVPVIIWATLCILVFLGLRSRCRRVYSPRASLKSLHPYERTAKLPDGIFKWLKPFCRIPDSFVLTHGTIDGFLFLRFLRILTLIFGVGCLVTLPVLLPLHAMGGGGNTGLDVLTMGNVTSKSYYYAHATLAWVYFGFILYVVLRESLFCIHLRHVCLTSPYYANGLSARTVLVTCVPPAYLTEAKLRETFGGTVRRAWIPKDTEDLQDLIKERQQTALRLEKAEVQLIRMANMARSRALGLKKKKRLAWFRRKPAKEEAPAVFAVSKDEESPSEPALPWSDVSGSVAAQWISHRSRPVHRPLANAGRRADTIKWTRNRLKALARRILKERNDLLLPASERPVIPAAFIEFASQADAQTACQTLSYHQPLYMSERHAGVRPYEIVWESLSLSWWSRMARKFGMQAFLAVMVIFWSLPCAFVGMVSNIEYLSSKISFLGWIMDLPGPILGVLTGLVPALALAWLMSIVPWIIRIAARVAGTPTLALVEVYCQRGYIVFQIVQVFLVTTLTSAISAALTQILENPMSATTLLSQNLPKSSNFYISYILVQALVFGAANLVRFFDILRYVIFPMLPHDHRRRYERYHTLQHVHWGALFPVFTNLGIIGISYACIAPLVLAFGTVGIGFLYYIFRYNVLYVFNSEVDTRGLLYPAALMQLIWGLYLAEACLIGLFALKAAAGPIGMTAALLITTILVHRSLLEALGPLLFDLPKSLAGSGTTGGAHEPLDPFSLARAEHLYGQTGPDAVDEHPSGPQHTLSADIAEDDNADHIPGATRGVDDMSHHRMDSSSSKQRYTISYNAPASIDSPSTTSNVSDKPNKASSEADAPGPAWAADEKATAEDTNETTRGLQLPEAATEPFRLEGFSALFKTFYSGGSTLLSKQLAPHSKRIADTLAPVTTHRFYISSTARLHRILTYLSPLYYASSTHIPDLVAKLREVEPPEYPDEIKQMVYLHPSMYAPPPRLWIPRDAGGVSRQECEHNNRLGKGVVECTDEGWEIDEKGKLFWEVETTDAEWCRDRGWRGRW